MEVIGGLGSYSGNSSEVLVTNEDSSVTGWYVLENSVLSLGAENQITTALDFVSDSSSRGDLVASLL